MGYRDFYKFNLSDFYIKELESNRPYIAFRKAKGRLRMYANLFCRDMRKDILNDKSTCCFCGSDYKLQIDHIQSVFKWGENNRSNIQILCFKCNRLKSKH